jgi:hypothetical protein
MFGDLALAAFFTTGVPPDTEENQIERFTEFRKGGIIQ